MNALALLVLSFMTLLSATALAEISVDGVEYLRPDQKAYLEEGIAASEWPSYCPKTRELALKRVTPPAGALIKTEVIVIDKSRRLIHLMHHDQIIATYRMALGTSPVGRLERSSLHFFWVGCCRTRSQLLL